MSLRDAESNGRSWTAKADKDEGQNVILVEQAVLKKGRGCADRVFVLRHIIEQCEEWQKTLTMSLGDFKKAFDCVHRESMWKIVELYGIQRKIINFMRNIYVGSESCAGVNQGQTDFSGVGYVVRQGDSLSPLLFNIVPDLVLSKVELAGDGIEWSAGRRLNHLAYADDLCFLADDMEDSSRKT